MRKIYFVFFALLFVLQVNSQPFSRATIPPSSQQYAVTSMTYVNGLYLTGGYYQDTLNDRYSATLIAVDTSGNLIWEYLYQTVPGTHLILKDVVVGAGCLFISGSVYDTTSNESFVSKLDLNGNEIWSRYLSSCGDEVAGTADSGCVTSGGGIVMKLDKYGNQQWSEQIVGVNSANELIVYGNDDIILFGNTTYNSYGHACIVKLDQFGNVIWNKRLTVPMNMGVSFIDGTETDDGGFAVVSQAGIAKVDSNGVLQWSYTYEINGYASPDCIVRWRNNALLVSGATIYNGPFWDQITYCIDSAGSVIWSATDTTGQLSSTRDFVRGSGSNFAIVTDETNFASYVDYVLVVSDTSTGYLCADTNLHPTRLPSPVVEQSFATQVSFPVQCIPTTFTRLIFGITLIDPCTGQIIEVTETTAPPLQIYPNPFMSSFMVNNPSEQSQLFLYSSTGAIVKEQWLGTGEHTISCEQFATGIYFYSIVNNGQIISSGRLIKE